MNTNKKIMLLSVTFLVTLVITACGSLSDPDSIWNQTREVDTVDTSDGNESGAMSFTPGTFTGTSDIRGYGGLVSVSITIDADGRISDIEVTEHEESDGFYQRAFDNLIPLILDAQSANVDVDAASGATYSAGALISAVENALSQAGGGPATITNTSFTPGTFAGTSEIRGYGGPVSVSITIDADGRISDIEVTEHAESDGFYQRAFDNLIPLILDAQSADVNIDAASGATYSASALISAIEVALSQAIGTSGGSAPAAEANFTPGTFNATSDIRGYGGPVSVTISVDADGRVSDIEVTEHQESDGFYQRAFDNLIPLILDAQTTDISIDAASGATYSSEALLDAVSKAFDEAR